MGPNERQFGSLSTNGCFYITPQRCSLPPRLVHLQLCSGAHPGQGKTQCILCNINPGISRGTPANQNPTKENFQLTRFWYLHFCYLFSEWCWYAKFFVLSFPFNKIYGLLTFCQTLCLLGIMEMNKTACAPTQVNHVEKIGMEIKMQYYRWCAGSIQMPACLLIKRNLGYYWLRPPTRPQFSCENGDGAAFPAKKVTEDGTRWRTESVQDSARCTESSQEMFVVRQGYCYRSISQYLPAIWLDSPWICMCNSVALEFNSLSWQHSTLLLDFCRLPRFFSFPLLVVSI